MVDSKGFVTACMLEETTPFDLCRPYVVVLLVHQPDLDLALPVWPVNAVQLHEFAGFLERFSNEFGSHASSNGTYTTGDYYHGKYGLSMKVRGLDHTNSNAEARAIVIHNAWYAEPEMIGQHGKLGRSEGCFAFSRKSQWDVMRKLAGGRMIYAEKLA